MEKKKPHYNLSEVQAHAARLGAAAFTKAALDGGRGMGLTTAEMLEVVAALSWGQLLQVDDDPRGSQDLAGRLSRGHAG